MNSCVQRAPASKKRTICGLDLNFLFSVATPAEVADFLRSSFLFVGPGQETACFLVMLNFYHSAYAASGTSRHVGIIGNLSSSAFVFVAFGLC